MIVPRLLGRGRPDYRCQQLVEVVTDYLEGSLSTRDRARFDRHLRHCDGCEGYLAQIRRTIELTGRLTVHDIDRLGGDARQRLLDAFGDFHASRP